jgi:transmembrane sensor
MTETERVEKEAADWLAREDRGLGFREREAFEAWRDRSTFHRVAYLRLQSAWAKADRLADPGAPVPAAAKAPRRWIAFSMSAGATALAACLLVLYWPSAKVATGDSSVVSTGAGRQRSLSLADGTKILLADNTTLHTRLSDGTRSVTIDRGKAYFDVMHDEHRPFVVLAGRRRITDIGTKFSVSRNGEDVEIAVTEGKVRVDDVNAPSSAPIMASANDLIIAKADEILLSREAPVRAMSRAAGGEVELLTFADEPLSAVVQELNKHSKKKIHVAASAGDIKIGGSFRSNNTEGFKALLQQGFGVTIREDKSNIYISK